MDFKQRKAHRYIWILIAVGFPILLIFSIKDLDYTSPSKPEINASKARVSENQSSENEWIRISKNADDLEILLKKSLKSSASVLYELNDQGEAGEIIGQLSSVGFYSFHPSRKIKGVILFDDLKKTEITKLKF